MLYKHCRICLMKTFQFSCFGNGEGSIKYKLRLCMPEMDLNIVSDPVLCESCTRKLDVAYSFKLQCLNMEDEIIKYIKTIQPDALHIQMLDVIRMSITESKDIRDVSNASFIELSDAEDDNSGINQTVIPITQVNLPNPGANILDQTIETIHLNQVATSIPVVCITPSTEPIIVENASKEETMEIDLQTKNRRNDRDFLTSGRNGRKYIDVFQERISKYLSANTPGSASAKRPADSEVEVIIVEDGASANENAIPSYEQGRKQDAFRNDRQIVQAGGTLSVSKENLQQNASRNSYNADRNKIKGHVMKDGAIIKKPFGCTKCSETFETIDRLLKHVREHKSSTVTNYTKNCRVTSSKSS